MTRTIVLHVLPGVFRDPMQLVGTTAAQRAVASSFSRVFPLVADPPPDTLFMRATNSDLGVFGEDLEDGHLSMIDAAFTLPLLSSALECAASQLTAFANGAVTAEEVATALSSGSWAADPDSLRAPILQAAGFARQLHGIILEAAPSEFAVVWEYTGGLCRYAYPPEPMR